MNQIVRAGLCLFLVQKHWVEPSTCVDFHDSIFIAETLAFPDHIGDARSSLAPIGSDAAERSPRESQCGMRFASPGSDAAERSPRESQCGMRFASPLVVCQGRGARTAACCRGARDALRGSKG
jgi:hypothetical protein